MEENEPLNLAPHYVLTGEYKEIWRDFIRQLNGHYAYVKTQVERIQENGPEESFNIAEYLRWVAGLPYHIAHELHIEGADRDSHNIGSITGLFFEQNVASVLIPYVRKRIPKVVIYLNSSESHKSLDLPRDPDILLTNGKSKQVVVEVKSAPKKPDIQRLEHLRTKYQSQGIAYFVIANYLALDSTALENLVQENWFVALWHSGKAEVKPRYSVEQMLADIVAKLS
jgi:cobalamin biosynthesis Mg chelatase CobN